MLMVLQTSVMMLSLLVMQRTLHVDQSTDDLIFDDNAKAVFGSSSDGLEIYHDASDLS